MCHDVINKSKAFTCERTVVLLPFCLFRPTGNDTPSIAHLRRTQYLRAFIEEVFRFKTIAPSNLPHTARYNAKLKGYDIPKNTIVSCGGFVPRAFRLESLVR